MSTCPTRGRVYRRCGCRDESKRQIGASCPKLKTDGEHGSWAYAVDLPSAEGDRKTRRRSAYLSEEEARYALELVVSAERTGVFEDPRVTVGAYLAEWLTLEERTLKPSTVAGYSAYVRKDLLPVFGAMRLCDLRSRHIEEWVADSSGACSSCSSSSTAPGACTSPASLGTSPPHGPPSRPATS